MVMKIVLVVVLCVIVFSGMASANFLDWFRDIRLSPNQPKNVSVSIVGVQPVTIIIHNQTLIGIIPNQNTFLNINFPVTMIDPNGANDLNDSSVQANFSRSGEITRKNDSCSLISGQNTALSKNYSCSISMWYFDGAGDWSIEVVGRDIGNGTIISNTSSFSYGSLKSIEVSSEEITFPALIPGATNVNANNDPTFINNTGNWGGALNVRGVDLYAPPGQPVPSAFFGVGNFSISHISGNECIGTALQNATDKSSTNINRGNVSAGFGQTNVSYCITGVPSSLPAQQYSTASGGSWLINI